MRNGKNFTRRGKKNCLGCDTTSEHEVPALHWSASVPARLSKNREEKQRRAKRRRCSSWLHRNIWRHPILIRQCHAPLPLLRLSFLSFFSCFLYLFSRFSGRGPPVARNRIADTSNFLGFLLVRFRFDWAIQTALLRFIVPERRRHLLEGIDCASTSFDAETREL